jgi:alpha-L-fucosidase
MIIKKLVECVSKGGNMLLNIGPDAKGRIPDESLDILAGVGKWMRKNGESIYGCGNAEMEKPDTGRITKNGNVLYYHIMENPIGPAVLSGIKKEQVKKIWLVSTGAEMKVYAEWIAASFPNHTFINFGENPLLPDPVDTVVAVELADK